MENIQEKARNYFFSGNSEKELQLARLGFVEGYKQALKDSKSTEMLEMLKELLSHYEDVVKGDYSPFALRSDIDKAKQLIKEAKTL